MTKLWKHPLYPIWTHMMERCYKPNATSYRHYGERGIKVYGPWHDAASFIEWIEQNLGPRPCDINGNCDARRHPYSLDRIDNNGNYEPGNVKWSTWLEQRENRRAKKISRLAAADIQRRYAAGETQASLAVEYDVHKTTISNVVTGKIYPAPGQQVRGMGLARGIRCPQAKLTEQKVKEIRARYAQGDVTCKALAGEYGVSYTSVYNVVSRKTWRHVE